MTSPHLSSKSNGKRGHYRKAIKKDFIRELRNNSGRFISVFFIVLLGAAFFSGIRSSRPSMLATVDDYYDRYSMMDIAADPLEDA